MILNKFIDTELWKKYQDHQFKCLVRHMIKKRHELGLEDFRSYAKPFFDKNDALLRHFKDQFARGNRGEKDEWRL